MDVIEELPLESMLRRKEKGKCGLFIKCVYLEIILQLLIFAFADDVYRDKARH